MASLILDNSDYYRGLENAAMKVTSPTGRTIYIYKKHAFLFSEPERLVWGKICDKKGPIEMTTNEMNQLKAMSEIPYFAKKR